MRRRSMPVERDEPPGFSPSCESLTVPSFERADVSVAPKSMCPIHDPAIPAARPESSGCRWRNEGCATCGGGAFGGEPARPVDWVGLAALEGWVGVVDR